MIEMRVILPTLVLLAAGVAQAVEPIYRMPSPRAFSGEIGDQMPVRDVGALTGAVTVTGWVKLGGWPDPKAKGRGLYTFFSGGDNFRCGIGANRKMFVLLDGKWISVTEEPFEVGGWTHFAFTWAPGRIELIADGRYLEVVAPAKGFPGPVRENLGFMLGSMNNWCPLKGELSDVKVYDRVLSLPEIEEAERDVVRRLVGATAPIAEVSRLRRTKALEAADRESFGGREFIAAPVPCTDAMEMYVPDMSVPTNVLGRPLNVLLTPGEYESASFVVRSRKPVTGLCPRLSSLTCGEATLPPSVCDFRVVKVVATCTGNAEQGIRALKPFVLVHDDAIMRVDGEKLENRLRLSFSEGERYELVTKREKRGTCSADVDARKWPVRDAAEIRPLDLPARHTLQYYATFRVPESAKPGLYRGTLSFDGVPGVTLPVNVRVLPYALPKPMTKWDLKREFVRGTYYRQHGVDFSPDAAGGLSPVRNERQFRAELRNLREHGFNMCSVVMALHVPMCHWKCGSGWNAEGRKQGVEAREPTAAQREHFTRVVSIMREEGMLTDPMYLGTSNLGFRDWYVRSEHQTEMTKAWRMLQRYAREILGHDRVVLYGVDEADGDCLRGEFDFWEDFRKIGGRTYTTGSLANIPLVIGRIETDIAAGRPRKDYAAKMHASGGTMWTYANPQTYQKDNPRLFRINYGMDLYLADYDGFCTYAHNENVGNPWTDTDGAEWAFVIQTEDGVVDTPSYEGYREAIDDIRYATKLQMEIERALAGPDAKARETARAARAWLDAIHVDMVGYDPEWIRWQMVEWTLKLMNGIAIPGKFATLTFSGDGTLSSIREASGRELVGERCPFMEVTRTDGKVFPATGMTTDADGHLVFSFAPLAGTCALKVIPFDGGWTLETVRCDIPDVATLTLAHVKPGCKRWYGDMACLVSDEQSGVALRPYDPYLRTACEEIPNDSPHSLYDAPDKAYYPTREQVASGLMIRADRGARSFVGRKFGLCAGPRACLTDMLKEMTRVAGVPQTEVGGAWSLGAEANRGSYVFTTGMDLASADDWIEIARLGGFTTVHPYAWWERYGLYEVRKDHFPNGLDDLKATVGKFRDAGLRVDFHHLTDCIQYVDPLFMPEFKADPGQVIMRRVYTLSRPFAPGDTELYVNEQPWDGHSLIMRSHANGNVLLIGRELVQYEAMSREKPPYAFSKIVRGRFKTQFQGERKIRVSDVTYPVGTKVYYPQQRYGAFYPKPGSPLMETVANRISNVFNACGGEGVYFDGAEGMMTVAGTEVGRETTFRKFENPKNDTICESSCLHPYSWWYRSRIGPWDAAEWGAKRFVDEHVRCLDEYATKANLLKVNLGWWIPMMDCPMARGHFSDEMEYNGCKGTAIDAADGFQIPDPFGSINAKPVNFHSEDQLAIFGAWERARLARAFSDGLRAKLRVPGDEYRLRQGEDGVWRVAPQQVTAHRISDATARRWTVQEPETRPAELRVEALYAANGYRASDSASILKPSDCATLERETATNMTLAVGTSHDVERGDTLVFEASNGNDFTNGAWTRLGRHYPLPYLAVTNAVGLWVKGDGSGALLNVQLEQSVACYHGYSEHYLRLDFTGWRYVSFLLRERDAYGYFHQKWPYAHHRINTATEVYRTEIFGRTVERVNLYLNDVPAHGRTRVEVTDVRSLGRHALVIEKGAVEMNGEAHELPFSLSSGEFAECADGVWTRFSPDGVPQEARRTARMPSVRKGANALSWRGDAGADAPRAEVTVLSVGRGEPAFSRLDPKGPLVREALRPRIHAPGRGLSADQTVPVRPGESARLEIRIVGPVVRPAISFAGGTWTFPATLGANDVLRCLDGRTWNVRHVVRGSRRQLAAGTFEKPMPKLDRTTRVSMRSEDERTAFARLSLAKDYGTNPLFDGWYADPQIRVFGKEYWIFPTYSHEFAEQTFLDAFSSTDLKAWTKHERVLSTNEISWARGCFWAPDAQEKDGRYYLFFSANNAFPVSEKPEEGEPQKEPGIWKYGGIGVAVADRPEGPYRDLIGKPLVDRFWNAAQPIDQYVFSYKGDWYMVYGGWRKCNLIRLAPDFKSLVPFPDGRMWHPIDVPDYVEGSVMFERKGVWYFMYSSGAWTRDTYNVRYCTAKTPFGPFTYRGCVLSSQKPLATGAGHHSVLCMPGTDDWYICYHRRPIPNESPHHRVTCLDRLYFNDDGTIRPVVMTD